MPRLDDQGDVVKARHPEEARGLYRLALDIALAHDMFERASVACANLSDLGYHSNRYHDSLAYLERALEMARRIGDRGAEWFALSEMSYALAMLGRWDEALARLEEIPEAQLGVDAQMASPMTGVLEIYLHRGQLERARALLARYEGAGRSDEMQARGAFHAGTAAIRLAEDDPRGALQAADPNIRQTAMGVDAQAVQHAMLHALEAALRLGERPKTEELLAIVEGLPVGLRPPLLAATAHRVRARLAADASSAELDYVSAAAQLRELELPFHLAVVALEYGEWLLAQGREEEGYAQLEEARETFEQLEAKPWLERLDLVMASRHAELPA